MNFSGLKKLDCGLDDRFVVQIAWFLNIVKRKKRYTDSRACDRVRPCVLYVLEMLNTFKIKLTICQRQSQRSVCSMYQLTYKVTLSVLFI